VQLTRESPAHYTQLRDRLLIKGFTKRIKSSQGIEYRLPNGNYAITTDATLDQVFNVVKAVALTVDATPMVLVTETVKSGCSWSGLQKC